MPLKPLITLETSPSSTWVCHHVSSSWCLSNYPRGFRPHLLLSFYRNVLNVLLAWAPQSRRAGVLFNTVILAVCFLTSEDENAVLFPHVD